MNLLRTLLRSTQGVLRLCVLYTTTRVSCLQTLQTGPFFWRSRDDVRADYVIDNTNNTGPLFLLPLSFWACMVTFSHTKSFAKAAPRRPYPVRTGSVRFCGRVGEQFLAPPRDIVSLSGLNDWSKGMRIVLKALQVSRWKGVWVALSII